MNNLRASLLALLAALAGFSLRADPYTGYYYPSSIQAGTTNRIVVGGQRIGAIKGGWVSGEGVEIVAIEKTRSFPVVNGQGQGKWIRQWMRGVLEGRPARPPFGVEERHLLGWTRHPWWEAVDTLPPLEFSLLARYLDTPRNPLQMSPALSERLIITVVAAKEAPLGVREAILYDDRGASAPHPLLVTALPHAPEPLYQPNLPNLKPNPPPPPERPLALPVILDGQILPGQTDTFRLSLHKGPVQFRLTGREFQPFLGDAVPGFFNPVLRLVDEKGRELAFADDFHYLPDPILACRVPKDGEYRLEVRDNLYRGREDFVYAIVCTEGKRPLPAPQERAFACFPPVVPPPLPPASASAPAAEPFAPIVHRGVLARPGERDAHTFEIARPQTLSIELVARRAGSPLDGVVRLFGPLGKDGKGPLLATWDDVTNAVFAGSVPQGECDPIGTWAFSTKGTYRVTVSDRIGAGGRDFRYELRLKSAEPSFEVYAAKSAFVLHQGDRSGVKFKVRLVRRGGFTGKVTLANAADFLFPTAVIPAGTNEATVVCQPVRRDWIGVRRASFVARAEVAPGCWREVPVVPADEAEQAFAYTHLLPARAFTFVMLDIYGKRPTHPAWEPMPYDTFLPRKVLRRHVERPDAVTNAVAALNAFAETEVPVIAVPDDFDGAMLVAKLAASAVALRGRREIVTVEPPGGLDARAAVRAALAGITRVVNPDFTYADGDARRVRTLGRTAELPSDNDVLVYLPDEGANPLAESAGALARQLRAEGWCFDFVTDATLDKAALGRKYRVLCIPPLTRPMPEKSAALIAAREEKGGLTVIRADLPKRERIKKMAAKARREEMPKGVVFVRWGQQWGEGLYLVHNAGKKPAKGPWAFHTRGKNRQAVVMEVESGRILDLSSAKGLYSYTLPPGATAWFSIAYHPFQPR